MKRLVSFLAAALLIGLMAGIAQADTFDFSFTGVGIVASGTLDATWQGTDWLASSATGTINGDAVSLMGVGTCCASPYNDNTFSLTSPQMDIGGLAFLDTVTNIGYNPYYNGQYLDWKQGDAAAEQLDSFSITQAPEPSFISLLLASGAMAGAALRRRVHK
ncbi:MAG TPA: PEP-CTERM sorting domain-containing protein [Bryobacteraceae bacterium]|nr:PEP-CTERM sorting domain-containing protein [Bryobacteraceae bacterium]